MAGPNSVDLAHRVADFAYKRMAGSVKQEYENRISKWAGHTNTLVGHAKTAFRNHQNALQRIKAKQDAEQQSQAEFAMIALSLLSGPALLWVAGTIEHRVIPRLLGKLKVTKTHITTGPTPTIVAEPPARPRPSKSSSRKRNPGARLEDTFVETVYNVDPAHHSPVAAKVFGDFGGSLTEKLLVNPAIKAAVPDVKPLAQKIEIVGDSVTVEGFETSIRNALEEAKKFGGTAIMNYAGTILEDREFGDRWIARLDREQPSMRNATVGAREDAIRKMIREVIDDQRRAWAKSDGWFYYANDPKPLNDVLTVVEIEVEIWREWILSEGFHLLNVPPPKDEDDDLDTGEVYRGRPVLTDGRSGIELDRVLGRLVELGAFAGRTDAERDMIFRRIERAENSRPGGSVRGPWPTTYGRPRMPSPEEARRNRSEMRNRAGLLDFEVFEIEGKVDTVEEFQAIQDWIVDRKPQILGGKMAAIPRPITPLDVTNLPV